MSFHISSAPLRSKALSRPIPETPFKEHVLLFPSINNFLALLKKLADLWWLASYHDRYNQSLFHQYYHRGKQGKTIFD
jgi:hypothetical protein